MNNALYFPYISIPNSTWIMQTILYWDKVGSIVPIEFTYTPGQLDPFMQELVQARLVEQIIPLHYIPRISKFENEFINFLDNNPELSKDKDQAKMEFDLIHIEKLGNLVKEIEKRKLGKKSNGQWFQMEKKVAWCFMTYLALGISKVTDFKPITDRPNGLSTLGTKPYLSLWSKQNTIRTQLLENVLPVPTRISRLADIHDFKERYYTQLLSFRNYIEQKALDIAAAPEEQFEERVYRTREEIELRAHEIYSRMQEKFPHVSFASMFSVFASVGTLVKGVATRDGYDIVSGMAGLIEAADAAFGSNKQAKNEIGREPLAYAVFASRELSNYKYFQRRYTKQTTQSVDPFSVIP